MPEEPEPPPVLEERDEYYVAYYEEYSGIYYEHVSGTGRTEPPSEGEADPRNGPEGGRTRTEPGPSRTGPRAAQGGPGRYRQTGQHGGAGQTRSPASGGVPDWFSWEHAQGWLDFLTPFKRPSPASSPPHRPFRRAWTARSAPPAPSTWWPDEWKTAQTWGILAVAVGVYMVIAVIMLKL